MIKKDKKKKLRGLLAMLEPENKQEILVKNIEDDLKDFSKRVEAIANTSDEVFDLQLNLEVFRNSLLQKISELPTKGELSELSAKYAGILKYVEDGINQTIAGIKSEINDVKDSMDKVSRSSGLSLTKLQEHFDRRIAEAMMNRGGGSIPLQVSAGGTVANKVYAEVNFVGATFAVNNTTKKTDITTSGGSSISFLTAAEIPDQTRTTFTFSSATAQPSFLITDGVWTPAISDDGTQVNWTWNGGTKVATLSVPPFSNIRAIQ